MNIDYIVETYCVNKEKAQLACNGKCHLKKQLSIETSSKKNNTSEGMSKIAEAFYPLYFQNFVINSQNYFFSDSLQNNWNYNQLILSDYLASCFHPPDFSFLYLV